MSARKPQIVCICGSSRFVDIAAVRMWELEKAGMIAIGMHLLPRWYDPESEHHQAEREGVAAILDELHLRKIDIADGIYVVNPCGYIGERTRFEINYAREQGKPVLYMEDSLRSSAIPPQCGRPNCPVHYPEFNDRT
jgi:hypothetical protein